MAFERISKILETPDGSFVYAQADHGANEFRVICSGCPNLQKTPYNSSAGAILAASYHSEHDPDQRHVPTRR
ncbi:hypothetical protein ACFC08_17770 [Streptomyces sp. NPDC056112]|uniref:hypothetical protein n=1 Tax=Streptomyces sp. NPDC056112 TaxID=3345715 RepID=UPI0035E121D8